MLINHPMSSSNKHTAPVCTPQAEGAQLVSIEDQTRMDWPFSQCGSAQQASDVCIMVDCSRCCRSGPLICLAQVVTERVETHWDNKSAESV
jgi:hypothetical protein